MARRIIYLISTTIEMMDDRVPQPICLYMYVYG